MPKIIKSKYVITSNTTVSLFDSEAVPKEAETEILSVTKDLFDNYDDIRQYSLLDEEIKKAKEAGNKIVSQAVEASYAEREKIIQKALSDAEEIKKQAYEQGCAEALKQKAEEISECIQSINNIAEKFQFEYWKYFEEYENNLKWLAIGIAEKILQKKIEKKSVEMASLVKNAVESVKNATWISVEVSEKMPKLIAFLENELLSGFENSGEKIKINAKDIPAGSCVIETPEGVLDASIQTQIENIKECFRQDRLSERQSN